MQYERPRSVTEACNLLAELGPRAKLMSGGTAVVLMMQQGLIAPEVIVDLGRLRHGANGWAGINAGLRSIRIGAGATLTEIAESQEVRSRYPSLVTAAASVGNPRIRNVATIGGNLAEADYASDPPSVLVSLDAECVIQGLHGERRLPVSEFITGFYSNALEPGELLTAVVIPRPRRNQHALYLKYLSRSSEDRPCVGVAVSAVRRDRRLKRVRVVVGAVASTPQEFPEVLSDLDGTELTDARIAECAEAYASRVTPMEDQRGSGWYRRRMVEVHVGRGLRAIRDGQGAVSR